MELYTLSNRFLPKYSITQFTSAIWTERYASAGDFELVVQPNPSMIDRLAKGTFLGLRGTKEIMQVETQSLENGLLTVKGASLPNFLNERAAWFANPEYDGTDTTAKLSAEYTEELTTAGQIISTAVSNLVIHPTPFGSYWAPINLDWARDQIPGLYLGRVDHNGAAKRLTISLGQLYDSISSLAQEEGLGFKLYLESASYTGSYVLKFATYRGKDRTSDQNSNLLIRLSPKLDSLTDVKEINSISQYKNVFYVVYKNEISTHYIPGLPIPTGFDRRVIVVEAPDLYFNPALPDYAAKVAAFREQVARNAIANHVYIQAVDGRISQQIGYKFGDDYYLGDVIELEGFTGLLSKARVTEYIRSQDQFGEQEYPTLAVLDPLFTGYMPDLEPDSDFNPDWAEDPDYDFDYEDDPDWATDPDITTPSDSDLLDPRDPPDYNPDMVPVFDDTPTVGDGNGDGGGGGGGPHEGDFEFLDLTYRSLYPNLGYFIPPDPAPFYESTSAGTYTCDPSPLAPPGSQPVTCLKPWPTNTYNFVNWTLADFLFQSGGTSLEGPDVTFGNPPPGYPHIDFITIEARLEWSVFGSAGATSGCYVDPPGWPGYGQAHCGDPVHLSELRFFVEIGVQLIPFGDGEYQGLLSFPVKIRPIGTTKMNQIILIVLHYLILTSSRRQI
jgi:hypothetical protein